MPLSPPLHHPVPQHPIPPFRSPPPAEMSGNPYIPQGNQGPGPVPGQAQSHGGWSGQHQAPQHHPGGQYQPSGNMYQPQQPQNQGSFGTGAPYANIFNDPSAQIGIEVGRNALNYGQEYIGRNVSNPSSIPLIPQTSQNLHSTRKKLAK
ncbi:hypothetical protein AWJ20_2530 [Sugiyamaella lignohabitans]|uniref:Uncharacterized protein n=1 Tax=Sugiyamaella lignohabitans TaxID=796027 RepID=A0A167F7M3_9ASCO|nr:uncharacterized protein AWJ20_2530 [Sugiyamaella lignohabitans]ANB14915.1 hypothetical protein AWJ20_2530 [Sugiyamaella lignohabitans]